MLFRQKLSEPHGNLVFALCINEMVVLIFVIAALIFFYAVIVDPRN